MDKFKFRNIPKLSKYYEKHKKNIDIHLNDEEYFRKACENGFLECTCFTIRLIT